MRLKEIKERLAAITKRMGELDTELRSADAERITQIEIEANTLKEERTRLTSEMAELVRSGFSSGTPGSAPGTETDEGIKSLSTRQKISLIVGRQARKKSFTEAEQRALGTALTTTATTFVEAAANADGVNNAGVLIPTNLVLDFLREDELLSPILEDISFTYVKGLVDFPYRVSRDKAKVKAQGAAGKDNQMEWSKLTGAKGYLQTIIAVTDEVLALSDIDFGAYIMSQMMQDIVEDWTYELIYGTGADDRIKGITYNATAAVSGGYETDKEIDAIIAGIKLCKGKYRRGAKVYVAQDVYDAIAFAVDDEGRFRYPLFNNTAPINAIGSIPVVVDENLADGDFIIGNVSKYYKANSLIPLRIETDRLARKGITEYIASGYFATVPHPSAFIHGYKKA
jgi:HK97 family phage major capsid protein